MGKGQIIGPQSSAACIGLALAFHLLGRTCRDQPYTLSLANGELGRERDHWNRPLFGGGGRATCATPSLSERLAVTATDGYSSLLRHPCILPRAPCCEFPARLVKDNAEEPDKSSRFEGQEDTSTGSARPCVAVRGQKTSDSGFEIHPRTSYLVVLPKKLQFVHVARGTWNSIRGSMAAPIMD